MKSLILSTILAVSLSTLSSASLHAADTKLAKNGPRCEPYPECQLTINKHPQGQIQNLSDIYRFDKMQATIS